MILFNPLPHKGSERVIAMVFAFKSFQFAICLCAVAWHAVRGVELIYEFLGVFIGNTWRWLSGFLFWLQSVFYGGWNSEKCSGYG